MSYMQKGDEVTVEFFPQTLVTQNQAGEWKEFKVVRLRCSATEDRGGIFFNTGRMNNEGVILPMTETLWETFCRRLWHFEYGIPCAAEFNCTFRLTEEGLIPTAIIHEGESYSLSS